MSLKLAHVCLGSPDLDRSLHFYGKTLGLKTKFNFLRNGKLFGFYLELADDTFIEIFGGAAEEVKSYPLRHFCLETDDIDDIARRLEADEYTPTKKKLGADQSWQIWVESPEGLRFEFHEYTKESSQRTGNDCVVQG